MAKHFVVEYDPLTHSPEKGEELRRRQLAGHDDPNEGTGCTYSSKIVHPLYFEAEADLTITNNLNSWIVLGRDRPAGYGTGYGGEGDRACATIDLVVGRGGVAPRKVDPEKVLDEVGYHPSFSSDAARLYISQKSDVDDNFAVAPGSIGSRRGKSVVAMKADNVRIMASEGIKLVTKITNYTTGDSRGNIMTLGIDLIAGNDSGGLQPLAKGKNLVSALDEIYDLILKLTSTVAQIVRTNVAVASVVGAHTHAVIPNPVGPGKIAAASVELALAELQALFEDVLVIFDEVTTKVNCETSRVAYLSPGSRDYICSRHNNTN